jgi:Fe-S oxidoreductase
MSGQDRFAWADGLDVPTVKTNPDFEVLYWVGCAAAFDPRLQRVARSIVKLFIHARVNFAVLGSAERCTGETARRMGDELLFQQLASENIASFDHIGIGQGQKRIVSHCPHCVNSLRFDYAQLGTRLQVVHHTEFLAELVETGQLVTPTAADTSNAVTYHDPCYLARALDVTDAPRKLLKQSMGEQALTEMPRRREHTACCGAGGGRMWFDDGI